LAGNGFACCLNCQADGEWTSPYSTPHCPDQQDVAFSDLDHQLAVSKALAKVISSTIVHYSLPITGSDRQSDFVNVLIQYPNAFEYLVSCTQYTVGVNMWVGPFRIYPALFPFQVVIADPSFYISGTSLVALTLNLTITVYSRAEVPGWSFEKSPVNFTSTVTSYAKGLCQSPWPGVTCSRGTVVGLNLKALGVGGKLRSSIGLLTRLTTLVLSSNAISGVLDSSLGYLTNLNSLELASNQFTGLVPHNLSTSA